VPDLDNLIKAAVGALEGVIGSAPDGKRLEADDVRVDRNRRYQAPRPHR
jgi:hypothetical protein